MDNLSFSKKDDIKEFLKEEKFNKILIICGEKSFKESGASKLFQSLIINKKIEFYLGSSQKKYSIGLISILHIQLDFSYQKKHKEK